MNAIETEKRYSIYEIYDLPYLDLKIDGIYLDEYLDKLFPENDIIGMVPPCSGWLLHKFDEVLFWERYLPENGESSILPILICPDDQDYTCLTVVTEVIVNNNQVTWNKFGIDQSYEYMKSETLGKKVDWLIGDNSLNFNKDDYITIMKKINDHHKNEYE